MGVHNGLREAYEGHYEEDHEVLALYQKDHALGDATDSYADWLGTWVEAKIRSDSPAKHLEIYCEWNGIINYHRTLYDLATGGGVS